MVAGRDCASPRYVAEVSASAMAVEEEVGRVGRDLQRNSTEEVEGWGEEELAAEAEEEVEEEEAEEGQRGEEAEAAVVDDCDTETVKEGGECNRAASQEEVEVEESSPLLLQEHHSPLPEVQEHHPPLQEVQERGSLLQEVRASLQEVQEEASTLLRQIHREEE